MNPKVYHVLFICTHNSARSIMAEGLLNGARRPDFVAHSAGSQPSGQVQPLALATMARMHLHTEGYRSKSWGEFAAADAPPMDFVFTVCDNAAGEVCPYWPGQPMTAHWGVSDPAGVVGSEIARTEAFREAFRVLERRIGLFTSLPIASLDRLSLAQKVRDIGVS